MAALILRYEPVLRMFFRSVFPRLRGQDEDDVVQGFLTDYFVAQKLLSAADPARGRFRSLLFTAFRNHVLMQVRRDRRVPPVVETCDVGAATVMSASDTPSGPVTHEEVVWAKYVLTETLRRAEWDLRARGHVRMWEILRRRMIAPMLEGATVPSHASLAEIIGLDDAQQSENLLKSAKRRFRQVLLEVLTELGTRADELEEDVAELLKIHEAARTLLAEDE